MRSLLHTLFMKLFLNTLSKRNTLKKYVGSTFYRRRSERTFGFTAQWGSPRRVCDETEGSRMHSVRGGENGRKEVDGIVRVTWLTICSVARGRESSSGAECEGIARVHLPESYFPPVHYRTVRAAGYVRATAWTSIRNCSRARVLSI